MTNTLQNPDVTEVTDIPQNSHEGITRRWFWRLALTTLLATVVAAQAKDVLAADVKATSISYRVSTVGIDYKTLADSPVAEMLSNGEAEFLENAKADYEEDTLEAWRDDIVIEVWSWKVSKATIENLREYTPNMLIEFAKIESGHPKYGILWAAGRSFHLDSLSKGTKS